MKKRSVEQFKEFEISKEHMDNHKGGSVNIFCELYIGRQERRGEPVDPNVLNVLMQWDQGLSQFFSLFF